MEVGIRLQPDKLQSFQNITLYLKRYSFVIVIVIVFGSDNIVNEDYHFDPFLTQTSNHMTDQRNIRIGFVVSSFTNKQLIFP